MKGSFEALADNRPYEGPGDGRGGSVGRASDSRSTDRSLQESSSVSGAHEQIVRVFSSKKCCACADSLSVSVPNPRVYTHAYERSRTHVKDPVVHVKVRWIMETRKSPACTLMSYCWVARLCCIWLSLGKATRISHGRNFHWDNKVYNTKTYFKRGYSVLRVDTGSSVSGSLAYLWCLVGRSVRCVSGGEAVIELLSAMHSEH